MIVAILLVALLLRLWNLNQSFWLDEAITATIARDLSFRDILTQYLPLDNHPPFYLLMIHWIFQVFPNTEIIARIPSVLFGVMTVYMVYLLAKEILNKSFAKIAALILATSPLAIYYSQEARMYSLTALLSATLVLLFLRYLKSGKNFCLITYTLVGVLLLYTDYLPGLMFLVFNLVIVVSRKVSKVWVLSQLLIVISFLPWLSLFLRQFALGRSQRGVSVVFDQILGKFTPKALPVTLEKFVLGRIPIPEDSSVVFVLIPLVLFSALLIWGLIKAGKNYRGLLISWLALPLGLSYASSLFIPVFIYFRFLFVLPAFCLLVGLGIYYVSPKLRWLLLGIVISINFLATMFYYFDPMIQREQWRSAVAWVQDESYRDGGTILFASSDPFAPYLWYEKNQTNTVGAFEGFFGKPSDFEKVRGILQNNRKVYLFTYLQDVTDPNRYLQNWILAEGYKKTSAKPFIGVGSIDVYEY